MKATDRLSSSASAVHRRTAASRSGRGLAREEQPTAVQAADGDEVELQLGRDPEVAATAPDRPEQLGIGVRSDLAQLAVRRDQLDPADRSAAQP
jgi:hypothetical protein